uniref:Uncharacterized protein n=1 Tax=Romanomermis culicivorax TaxID=13658 RepID=A0A915KN15_ROMCU
MEHDTMPKVAHHRHRPGLPIEKCKRWHAVQIEDIRTQFNILLEQSTLQIHRSLSLVDVPASWHLVCGTGRQSLTVIIASGVAKTRPLTLMASQLYAP